MSFTLFWVPSAQIKCHDIGITSFLKTVVRIVGNVLLSGAADVGLYEDFNRVEQPSRRTSAQVQSTLLSQKHVSSANESYVPIVISSIQEHGIVYYSLAKGKRTSTAVLPSRAMVQSCTTCRMLHPTIILTATRVIPREVWRTTEVA
jgi:hypothetical protein